MTWEVIRQGFTEVGRRLLEHVGRDVDRWSEVLELWRCFAPEWRRSAEAELQVVADGINDDAAREVLRHSIRGVLSRSQTHPGSSWALAEEDVPPLQAIFDRLESEDARERHRWLFSAGVQWLILGSSAEEDVAERARRQGEAVKDLVQAITPSEMVDFIVSVDQWNVLTKALAEADPPSDYLEEVLQTGLRDGRDRAGEAATLLLKYRALHCPGALGPVWNQVVGEDFGDCAEIRVLLAMPTTPETWRLLERRSTSLKTAYWEAMEPWQLPDDLPAFEVAMQELLKAGRAYRVLSWLGSRRDVQLPSELIIRSLHAIRQQLTGPGHTMQSHYLAQLFHRLDTDGACDRSEIAELEWLFFEDLRFAERKPRHLAEQLARSPEKFVLLVKLAFRPDDDAETELEPEASRETGMKAYGILGGCRLLPGTRPDSTIDGAVLEGWVKEALRLCKEAGRTRSGASKIGELLSRASGVSGRPWPPEPVCEVIEVARSRDLESGFVVGTMNGRGVTSRGLGDGGQLEHAEAARFRRDAEALSARWLRVAGCLESIAEMYESQAAMHDQLVERLEWP